MYIKGEKQYTSHGLPPTESTYVKEDMEDVKHLLDKKSWVKRLHNSSENTDWQKIEAQTAFKRYMANKNDQNIEKSSGFINVADGKIVGKWSERGSNNQAGSITATSYDSKEKKLYALSSGGSLWKGDIRGLTWEVFNDQLRFDQKFLAIVHDPSDASHIITSINGIPHLYKNDTWTSSGGFQGIDKLITRDLTVISNGTEIFFLGQESSSSPVCLYYSSNYGESFVNLRKFSSHHLFEMSITGTIDQDLLYILEQTSSIKANLYEWESGLGKLDLVNHNSPISFGNLGYANIKINRTNNHLYAYDLNNVLRRSTDKGINWNIITQLPVRPWDDGLFISSSQTNTFLMPNVEIYRSSNGGQNWNKVNNWIEYYENPSIKLHADIMHIAEYQDDSQKFIIVANHGGISISYDDGNNFSNIGLSNLNVSQYYSAKTYPKDSRYVFGGSQDQGLQRTLLFEEGTANFTQMFSGDFGHLQFTNNDKSLWAVFPGGLVLYYDNPTQNNFPSDSYFLESINQDVWLPPIIKSPYHSNSVLLAGGSSLGHSGSYIIELQISDLGNLSFSQWPFDFSQSGGTLSYIAVNESDQNIIYALTSNGKFYKSTNKGQSFTQKTQGLNDAHYLYGSKILSSKKNKDLIFIGGSGYDNSPIFVSNDGGESFESLQFNLPNTTIFDMTLDPSEQFLFTATEAGPFAFVFKESKWHDLSQGISPNQTYWSVEFVDQIQTVRYATFGRGIWDLKLDNLSNSAEVNVDNQIKIYPNPASDHIKIDTDDFIPKNIKIINVEGKLIEAFSKEKLEARIFDVSNYTNGLYYIIFESENNSIIKKFIKI